MEEALRRIGTNSIEAAMEWLITHPDEPASQPSAAAGSRATEAADEDELSRALVAALSAIGSPPASSAQAARPDPSSAPDPATSSASAMDTSTPPAPSSTEDDKGKGPAQPPPAAPAAPARAAPGSVHLVDSAVSILCRMPSGIFSMSDLLITLVTKEEGKDRPVVLTALMDKIK